MPGRLTAMHANLLKYETSPYLLQHADNPVHWQPWGEAAFAEARRENRPVLLSIGYAACHWCHVMAHESFEDPEIAALINDLYVPVKLDREERPDIDHVYQAALALLGQPGGWPLTMFLTAEGEPFWGGTYFPPRPSMGRPGFPQILKRIAEIYRADPDAVRENRQAIRSRLRDMQRPADAQPLGDRILFETAQRLLPLCDMRHGGIGGAPKFPHTSILELLWRTHIRYGDESCREAVLRALDAMAHSGIYDHLGGGFARYSVDARWHVPHFEKMLYDNAELVELYSLVHAETQDPLYRNRVAATIAFLERELRTDEGAFAAALDADSEGEEGKYYVWTKAEIDRLLAPSDAALFCAAYGVTEEGNWEGHNVLHALDRERAPTEAEKARLAACREALLAARAARVRPMRDDKILADWNGLAIRALVRAGMQFDRPDWIALGRTAFAFIAGSMTGEDGRIHHSHCAGKTKEIALLDDHVHMANAALALHETTGDEAYLKQSLLWADCIERLFLDTEHGGYFTDSTDADPLILRIRTAHDSALPSANGRLLELFAGLHLLTGAPVWQERAERQIAAFSGEVARSAFALASFVNGHDSFRHGVETTIFGARDDPAVAALIRAFESLSLPGGIVRVRAPGEKTALPGIAPDTLSEAAAGTAIVCAHGRCSLPITDRKALVFTLAEARKIPQDS